MSAVDAGRVTTATPELNDVLRFLAGTGCRLIEAREALIEKRNMGKGILMAPNKAAKKTGIEERPVFLSTAVIADLRRVIGERGRRALQEQQGDKCQPDSLRKRMRNLCEELRVELRGARLYSSRHNFISDTINRKKITPGDGRHPVRPHKRDPASHETSS